MTNSLKAAIATIDQVALDLETVPREPDSRVDYAIKTLRKLSLHAAPHKRQDSHSSDFIKGYQDALRLTVDALNSVIGTDTPSGTIADAIKDLEEVNTYLHGCVSQGAEPKGVPGGYADGDAYRQPVESIQVPPSMRGEPASALEEPAVATGARLDDFGIIKASDVLEASGTARMVKKDASKGEGIVQACAQIRGEIANNAHGDWRGRLLDHVRNIEDAAFSTDAPTFALNANGVPLDIEQVRLIGAIKEAQAQLLSLGVEVQSYLLAKQQRLRAICDEHPVEGTEARVTDDQQAAYKAYDDFCKATGYTWLDRGLGDVQVGVMSMVRAVAGPTS